MYLVVVYMQRDGLASACVQACPHFARTSHLVPVAVEAGAGEVCRLVTVKRQTVSCATILDMYIKDLLFGI